MECIHVEEAVIWGKEMRSCTHKRDNFSISGIILAENLVQICLIIAEILLFMKCDLDLNFQGQLMRRVFVTSCSIILGKVWLKSAV